MNSNASNTNSTSNEERPKRWTPNKKRTVRSKKELDATKMNHLVTDEPSIYKGELDPRKKSSKEQRKPRSISRSEQKVMQKAKAIAQAHGLSEKQPATAESRQCASAAQNQGEFLDKFNPSKASPARLAALHATRLVRRRAAYAQEIIESTIDKAGMSSADHGFATLLTLGVVSTWGTLDEAINRCLASPDDLKDDVRDALRISTYELLFLKKEPHAAVDQGVELARAIVPSAARLANAVLRRVQALTEEFPFGDPTKDIEALSRLYGFPTWLAKQLITDMGSADAIDLMRASNDPAPLFIAVNAIKATDSEVLDVFDSAGFPLSPVTVAGITPAGCYALNNSRALLEESIAELLKEGKILVSDAAAQGVASCILETSAPEDLLEIGAGRGTKTILIQSNAMRKFANQVVIAPLDNHGFKTDLLTERASKYGVEISETFTGNAERLEKLLGQRTFQTVFVDAPCSGLGTLRRHHEIRWRITSEQIEDLAAKNLNILRSAAKHVSPGGSLIYSTCTVTYAENNGTVLKFLESAEGKNFKLVPINGKSAFVTKLKPGTPDAHFAVKFQRQSE